MMVSVAAGLFAVHATRIAVAEQRPADRQQVYVVGERDGVRVMAEFSDWCVMLGMKNKSARKVRVDFEYDVLGDKGSVHQERKNWVELDPGEFKGGAHFFTDDLHLEACPWVGTKERPVKIRKFRLSVRPVQDRTDEARREAERKRQEEEQERARAEEARRREQEQRLEQDKLREETTRNEEARQRETEQRARDERRAEQDRSNETTPRPRGAARADGCLLHGEGSCGEGKGGSGGRVATAPDPAAQRREESRRRMDAFRSQVRDADRRMDEQKRAHAQLGTTLAAGGDTSVAPSGTSRRFGMYIGTGALFFPVMIDSSGGSVEPYSKSRPSGGLAVTTGLDFFPRFGTSWGLGLSTFMSAGSAPLPGGGLYGVEASGTLRGYVGRDSGWTALARLGYVWRLGGWSVKSAFGSRDNGSAQYTVWRLGTGVRRCFSTTWNADDRGDARKRFCKRGIDLELGLDLPSIAQAGKTPVFGLSLWWRGFLRVGVTLAPGYPAAGDPRFPIEGERSGWLAVFQAERGWELYSRFRRAGDGRAADAVERKARGEADSTAASAAAPARTLRLDERECKDIYVNATACVRIAKEYLKAGGTAAARAPQLLETACLSESPSGCSLLASLHYHGRVVAKDEGKAQSLFERACDREFDAASCYFAGQMYQRGRPVQSDLKARALYKDGCLQRDARSCRAQGILERDGVGGPASPHLALIAFEQGCTGGDAIACDAAARLHDDGSLGAPNAAMAAVFFKEGCGRGLGTSCSALAAMHEAGRGVAADPALAAEYRRKACAARWPDESACSGEP